VRDQLLGRTPKDYDVATSATPRQVRRLFGYRRTVAIGAAFGVITVLGPRGAGQIEVATFRCDAGYLDGRHPGHVTFSTAEEDAKRRDFTINGLFYDPVAGRVIDFVGGQADLARRVIRAIGDPRDRFREDKLRMLRAVRFAAEFSFSLEARTREAIRSMAPEITVVSPERIAAEMQRMLTGANRVQAVRLLVDTALAAVVLPEVAPAGASPQDELEQVLSVLGLLERPGFALALAALVCGRVDAAGAERLARRWRLSNRDRERLVWLVTHHASLQGARSARWSQIQRLFTHEGIGDLLSLLEAKVRADGGDLAEVAWCRARLTRPREELDPPPLLTGDDLLRHGVPAGPIYRRLLDGVRDAQLDEEIHTRAEALALVERLLQEGD